MPIADLQNKFINVQLCNDLANSEMTDAVYLKVWMKIKQIDNFSATSVVVVSEYVLNIENRENVVDQVPWGLYFTSKNLTNRLS